MENEPRSLQVVEPRSKGPEPPARTPRSQHARLQGPVEGEGLQERELYSKRTMTMGLDPG
eukprot:4730129-Pleurochrysis_carterae.AAC.1